MREYRYKLKLAGGTFYDVDIEGDKIFFDVHNGKFENYFIDQPAKIGPIQIFWRPNGIDHTTIACEIVNAPAIDILDGF
jgi:hypothetical protein